MHSQFCLNPTRTHPQFYLHLDSIVDDELSLCESYLANNLDAITFNQTVLINISSEWGRKADTVLAGYCASKFALEGLTETVAKETENLVTVVSLDPKDGIATPMLELCTDAAYYNQRPSAEAWAKVAVPYMLSIGSQHSGQKLTVPEIEL